MKIVITDFICIYIITILHVFFQVVTFLDETVYCLPHALEHIPKKNLKLCKLKYRYDEVSQNY